MGVKDEGANQLQQDTREIIAKLGSEEIKHLEFRQSWAFIRGMNKVSGKMQVKE